MAKTYSGKMFLSNCGIIQKSKKIQFICNRIVTWAGPLLKICDTFKLNMDLYDNVKTY